MISLPGGPHREVAESRCSSLLHSSGFSLFIHCLFGSLVVAHALCAQVVTLGTSPNPSVFGKPVTLSATVPAGATGKVTFYDGATVLGTGTIASGTASLPTILLPAGARKLTAHYSGDGLHPAGDSNVAMQTVNATASLSFGAPASPLSAGASPQPGPGT
jgi:hypothetical protein